MRFRLRELRKGKQLSLEKAGEALDVSGEQLSKVERDKADPSLELLERAAEFYGCHVVELFTNGLYLDGDDARTLKNLLALDPAHKAVVFQTIEAFHTKDSQPAA